MLVLDQVLPSLSCVSGVQGALEKVLEVDCVWQQEFAA
jgi:hypothetical protein